MSDPSEATRHSRLTEALRRVILLRETGPKSAAWHRARAQTIWRLLQLLAQPTEPDAERSAESEA
ncbi:MAG: hypothetical protein HGA65_15195 [Oscillochloris sp.]|nr:hypothetical protein [Oscillochloris sp.]